MSKNIDINRLKDDAKKSCCMESYIILEQSAVFRIGAGAKLNDGGKCDFFLDMTINLCPGSSLLNTQILEKSIALAKELKAMNFELNCQEGQIICEKSLKGAEMNLAFEKLIDVINKLGLNIS